MPHTRGRSHPRPIWPDSTRPRGTPRPDPHDRIVHQANETDPASTHAVYIITDQQRTPLYIGTTARLLTRLREHANTQPWFTPDCNIYVEWYRTADQAAARERHAIAATAPRHNRRGLKATVTDTQTNPNGTHQLVDLETPAVCGNCHLAPPHSRGRCMACYQYRRRHAAERPYQLYSRYA